MAGKINLKSIGANDFVSSASFNIVDGVLTLVVPNQPDVTVDLDGRYLESFTETISSLTTIGTSGPATIVGGVLNIPQYSGGAGAEVNDLTTAVVWANVPDANITESSVTQHEAALTITESQISDLSHFSPSTLLADYSFTDNSTNWNLAYGWGDHSLAGYLTSFTETDPVFSAHTVSSIIDGTGFLKNNGAGVWSYDNNTYLTSFTETNDLTAAVVWANVPDANITQSSVTQHESALTITESQISDLAHFSPTSLLVDYSFTDNSTNWDLAYSWGDHGLEGYLTSFTETDPIFSAHTVSNIINGSGFLKNNGAGVWTYDNNTYLTSFTETNDLTAAVVWANVPDINITESSVTQHQAALTITESQISDLNHFTPTSLLADYSFVDNSTNWNTAYGWGDHSLEGYLTSFTETNDLTAAVVWANVPDINITESSVTQHEAALTITESQISDLSHFSPSTLLADYSFVDNSTNWNTAYGWGDHSLEGYLTSFTETDPIFSAHTVSSIIDGTGFLKNNGAGVWSYDTNTYLTSYTEVNDLTSSVTWANVPDANITESSVTQHESALTITESQISDLTHFTPSTLLADYSFVDNSTNWNTAYGWGDHDGLYLPIATQLPVTKAAVATEFLTSYDSVTGLFTSATPPDTTYTASNGVTLSGNDFQHSDTSSQTSVNNTGRTYIQDITLDAFGHITAISSATETAANVPTSLSVGTVTTTTVGITSDGGVDDVIIPAATATTAGLLTTAKWSEIVANTAKVSNATHTGDVTGSVALTIGTGKVTMAKLANIATQTFIGRTAAGTGVPKALTATEATAMLDIFSTTSTTKGLVAGSNNLGATYFLNGTGAWTIPSHTSLSNIGTNTHAQIDTHIGDASIHFTENPNWNTAYSWGDHSLAGYLTSFTETDPVFSAHTVSNIVNGTGVLKNNGSGVWSYDNTTYLSSFTETNDLTAAVVWANVPDINITESSVTQHESALTITESQISDLSHFSPSTLLADYSFVDNSTNWDLAYGWGDHSLEGYLTSFTETNDLTAAVVWANVPDINITESSVTQHESALTITESQISDLSHFVPSTLSTDYGFTDNSGNWDTAYGWGDHAGLYLDASTQLPVTKAVTTNEFLTSYTSTTGAFTSAKPSWKLSKAPIINTVENGQDVRLFDTDPIRILWSGTGGDYNLTWDHLDSDGYKHVPANGTTNSGKVLTAGATAGVYTWETPSSSAAETFETVSKNLKAYPNTLNYTGADLTSIVYTLPGGTITKTLNYTTGLLTSIVLSGDTPSGIDLTKTLTYDGSDNLTNITYA